MDEIDFYLKDLESRFPKDLENYYLSYSGGKDSHFLYWFIKEYLHDDKIEIVALNTYMEHPEIKERMYKYANRVLLPEIKPFDMKKKWGIPCFSKMQDEFIHRYQLGCRSESLMKRINPRTFIGSDGKEYKSAYCISNKARRLLLGENGEILHKVSDKCCYELKKKPFRKFERKYKKKPILGIRSSESFERRMKYKSCFTKSGKFIPLYDLSDEMLDKIYKRYNIEIPKIYQYINKTGCFGCPYGSWKHHTEKELKLLSQNQYKFVVNLFHESYDVLGIDYDKSVLNIEKEDNNEIN